MLPVQRKFHTAKISAYRVIATGPNTLLAKLDVKNIFRLLPVHPTDRHLLAMELENAIYLDTCLPFGLQSASKLFNILEELLAWIAQHNGVAFSIHYLDDFLTMGPPHSAICNRNMCILQKYVKDLEYL